jgi:phosphate transport system substrate-binding protein
MEEAMRKLAVFFCLIISIVFSGSAFAENLTIKGSTTVLPIMQKCVEAYMKKHPEVSISVSGGGSSFGVKALLDGTVDIGMASRLLKGSEEDLARERGLNLIKHVVAIDAVIPIVNPANPVDDLSIEQMRDIFAGKIKNWSDVGGKDERIVVISRDTSSGTYETWQKFVMGKGTRVFPGALLQASSGAVMSAVSKNEKAISYDGIGYVTKDVKGLKANGIEGDAESAKDGSYPISRTLQVYTNGQPKDHVKGFIDFIKSAEGQELVAQAGFIKLN